MLVNFYSDTSDTGIWFLRISPKTFIFKPSNEQWPFCQIKYYLLGQERIIRLKRSLWRWTSSPASQTLPMFHWQQNLKSLKYTVTIQFSLYIRLVTGNHQTFSDLHLCRPYEPLISLICWKFKFSFYSKLYNILYRYIFHTCMYIIHIHIYMKYIQICICMYLSIYLSIYLSEWLNSLPEDINTKI